MRSDEVDQGIGPWSFRLLRKSHLNSGKNVLATLNNKGLRAIFKL